MGVGDRRLDFFRLFSKRVWAFGALRFRKALTHLEPGDKLGVQGSSEDGQAHAETP